MNPNQAVSFAVILNLTNEAAMKAYVESLSNPSSPNYQQFLSQSEFIDRFGPSQETYDEVKQYLKDQGLTVTRTYDNRLLVDVRGDVRDFERTFQIRMSDCTLKGKAFFATDRDVTMPVRIASLVQGLVGLDKLSEMGAQSKRGGASTSGYTPQ